MSEVNTITTPPTNLSLTVPAGVAELTTGSDRFVTEANNFIVDSESTFQLADEIQNSLKTEAKQIDEKRKEFTRPLDGLKKQWMDWFKPAVEGRESAVRILQGKMSAFSRKQREEAEAAQREAERLARVEREKLEAEARKREAEAMKLKTEAGKANALREAEELRQTAQMMPETFAVSAPVPQTVASNAAQVWKGRVTNPRLAIEWLTEHPEWLALIEFKQSELNRLAKQFNTVPVPGFEFTQEDSYRAKGR